MLKWEPTGKESCYAISKKKQLSWGSLNVQFWLVLGNKIAFSKSFCVNISLVPGSRLSK